MHNFKVGEVVRHDFSPEQGTVAEIRDDEYAVYVRWDSVPERNDWFKPEVLIKVRGTANSHAALTLSDIVLTKHKPTI